MKLTPILNLTTATLLLFLTPAFLSENIVFSLPLNAQTTEINTQKVQADKLLTQGIKQYNASQFREAQQSWQEALTLYQQLNHRSGVAYSLNNLGLVYDSLGEYSKAIDYYHQSLDITKEIGDRSMVSKSLNNLGLIYNSLGEYSKAIDYYQQSLAITEEIGDRSMVSKSLNNLGLVYDNLGEYSKAIDYYQQSLEIDQEMGDRSGVAKSLNNLGLVYDNLGEYSKAIDYYQQSLVITQEIGDRPMVSKSLNNLGIIYDTLGDYEQAIDYYRQSLAITEEIGDRPMVSKSLNNLGLVYNNLGDYEQAIDYYQQSLDIDQEIGNPSGVAKSLNNLGVVYDGLGEYEKAINYYQQSLAITQEIGDRPMEALGYNNIALVLKKQNQPSVAIVFYKESVNRYQLIRKDIQELPQEQQKSYLSTIENTYRNLADLLLQQDRILEAQRVLDLLKIQELDDYLGGVRSTRNSQQGIPKLPPEKQINQGIERILLAQAIPISQQYNQLISLKNKQGKLTPQQEQELTQLSQQRQQIVQEFNDFIKSEEVETLIAQLTPLTRKPDLVDDLEDLLTLPNNLKALNQNAVLLYPIILNDRIEMIITTPISPPVRHTVKVTKSELQKTISEFRQQLNDDSSNPQKNAQKLYDWLIKPLENDLKSVNAQTIIYAPDGILRYVPLGALHDGKQWLIEQYAVNNITATSLTDLNTQPQPEINLLAGAYANVSHEFELGGEDFYFDPLPFSAIEVENLAQAIPKTKKVIDEDFNINLISSFDAYNVIHLATHASLVIGSPEQSFILFGDGKTVTLHEMRNWNFQNIDLIVLSACQTALGGNFGTGVEILGLGYRLEKAGVRASISSLWDVSDGGTQALMNAFYRNLSQKDMSKVKALQQAQIALINQDIFAHPNYWSPFILIGNGL